MSIQHHQDVQSATIDEKAVANYLRQNPDFFVANTKLLADLALPHPSGPAISLIERQVDVLRDQNRHYRTQLQELIQIARDNDGLIEHLQCLTLSLLDVEDLNETFKVLCKSLKKDLNADAVTIQLFTDPVHLSLDSDETEFLDIEYIARGDSHISMFRGVIAKGQPVCGRLKREQLDYLFGNKADDIASAALLPLAAQGPANKARLPLGMVAIGSHEAERFHAGMGTVFLKYLAELIDRKLRTHFKPIKID
ncbi:MAG TPA: DUF484 family protein [Gammaproteobacteria bacterium]